MWIFSQLPNCALCITDTCVGFSQPPELALYDMGLVYTCFSSLGLPSVSQGLCDLALAFQACPLHYRSCLHLSRLPRPTLYGCGLHALVLVLWTHSLRHEVCVHCRGLYASPLWALLGLPSAPRELSALERFVCCPTLGYLGPPSVM